MRNPRTAEKKIEAARRIATGEDRRLLRVIAKELKCSRQYLDRIACQIADQLNLPTRAPWRRKKKTQP